MRFLQATLFRLLCLGLLAGGILLFQFEISFLYQTAVSYLPTDNAQNNLVRFVVAIAVAVVALVGLIPWGLFGKKKSRVIEFEDSHGSIAIELTNVEESMNKMLRKLPEVHKINMQLIPADGNRKVRVVAEVELKKASGAGARAMTNQLRDQIDSMATRLLGVDEVVSVEVKVKRLVVDKNEEDAVIRGIPLIESTEVQKARAEKNALTAPDRSLAPLTSDAEPLA